MAGSAPGKADNSKRRLAGSWLAQPLERSVARRHVIGGHGVRGVTDPMPANHYSTLSTIQHVTGSEAVATNVLAELGWPTPTP